MRWFKEHDISTPNSHLSPDDDVQVQIEDTMTQLQIVFNTHWVKEHQTQAEGEELPWEATLKIEANTLANDARSKTSLQPTHCHQYSASRVMLYIANTPVIRNITK